MTHEVLIILPNGRTQSAPLSSDRWTVGRSTDNDFGFPEDSGLSRQANGMDIGFGAHGARNVQRVPAFLTGFGAYLGALALTLVRYPLLDVTLRLDDGPPERLATAMAAVMNGNTFGGSFRVTPQALPDDGLLDVLVVEGIGRVSILNLVPKVLRGQHGADPRLRLLRARRVTIESAAPLLVEADGEIAFEDARRLAVELLPGALQVLD